VVEFVRLLFALKNPAMKTGFITIMPERMASSSIQASVDGFKQMKKSKRLFVLDVAEDDESEEISLELQEAALKRLDSVIAKGELVGDKDTKLLELESIIKELEKRNIKKMIIFSFFKRTIDYLHQKLLTQGLKVEKMHGSNTPDERYAIVDNFKKDKFDILISSEVGSEGLDMQFCNVVINYDMPWNPMRVEQRIGRIDRIGQKADILLIFNLCLNGSIEDRIYRRLYEKLGIFENSIGELEPILGEMSSRFDMEAILELSPEEQERLVDTNADAALRCSKESDTYSKQMEEMLNNDFLTSTQEDYLEPKKEDFFRQMCQEIVIDFFESKNISHSIKDRFIKLDDRGIKELQKSLRELLGDKRSPQYTKNRHFASRVGKVQKFAFFDPSEDLDTENITLSHPLVDMLANAIAIRTQTECVAMHPSIKSTTMHIYSIRVTGIKDSVQLVGFLGDGSTTNDIISILMESAELESTAAIQGTDKSMAERSMLTYRQELYAKAQSQNQRYIDSKIESLKKYYDKKISIAQKETQNKSQEIRRMREGELANLQRDMNQKIVELENSKNVSVSSELVGVVHFV